MFEFLRIQYQMGKINQQQLKSFTGKYITEKEYQKIIGDAGE